VRPDVILQHGFCPELSGDHAPSRTAKGILRSPRMTASAAAMVASRPFRVPAFRQSQRLLGIEPVREEKDVDQVEQSSQGTRTMSER
jgi:hypothetical protein